MGRIILMLLLAAVAWAEGLDFAGDRYAGARVVFGLEPDQIKVGQGRMRLTDTQRTLIREATQVDVDGLWLWTLAAAQDTCTCELADIGIIYGRYVVVPLDYITGGKADRRRTVYDKAYYAHDSRVDGVITGGKADERRTVRDEASYAHDSRVDGVDGWRVCLVAASIVGLIALLYLGIRRYRPSRR